MQEHVLKIIGVVFPVFSIIGIGYVFARFKRISLEPIIDVLLYLTIPALVVSSLIKKPLVVNDLLLVSLAACAVVLGTWGVSWVYLRVIKRAELRGFYLSAIFMNSGNMAFPLALLAFGAAGLTVAVLYYLAISLLVYSLGIYIAKGRGGFAEIFKLPLIYAAAVGLFVNLTATQMPQPLIITFDMLGAATIPLMQISLGYRLHSASLKAPGISLAGSLIRIVGGFLFAWAFVSIFGIEGLNRKVILLSSTMPSAVISFVMSHKYKIDSDLVASIVALSTVLSVISTSLLLLWIMD